MADYTDIPEGGQVISGAPPPHYNDIPDGGQVISGYDPSGSIFRAAPISDEEWFRQTYGIDPPRVDFTMSPSPYDRWYQETFGRLPSDQESNIHNLRQQIDPLGATAYFQQESAANRARFGMPEPTPMREVSPQQYGGGPPTMGDVARSVGQAFFGLGDEAAGVAAGVGAAINPWDHRSFSEAYQQTTENERQQIEAFRIEHPEAAFVAETVPAMFVAAPGAGWAARAATIAGKAARGAAVAGGYGAAYGFGASEGGLPGEGPISGRFEGAVRAAVPSAGIGAMVPVLAPVLARGTSTLYSIIRHPLRGTIDVPVGINAAERVAQANEFGIPLTRGQATANPTQQAREQAMLQGTRGEAAQRTLLAAANSQNEAIRTAATEIASQIGGMGRMVGGVESGQLAISAIRNVANDYRNTARTLYQTAEQINPTISNNTAEFLPQSVAYHIVNGTDFTLSASEHPTAFRAMGLIDNLSTMGGDSGVVPLSELMRVRRQINALTGVNDADSAAIRVVRDAYDAAINDLFDNQMFSGDPAAIQAWREADSNYARYRSLTNPQSGDDAGRIIAKMITRDVTPNEVANWLYGSSLINPPGSANRVASTLRDIFGADSEEWQAIRAAAWTRLVTGVNNPDEVLSAGTIANNITGFVSGRGSSLASTLFSDTERNMMLRFANTMRLLVPSGLALNPSRTSYRILQALRPFTQVLTGAFGFLTGNWPGAVLGMVGQPAARDLAARFAANRATMFPLGGTPLFTDPAAASRALATVLQAGNITLTPRLTQ